MSMDNNASDALFDAAGNPAGKYKAYLKYEQAYKEAVAAYHTAFAEAQADPLKLRNWPITGKQFTDDLDFALSRWNTFGYKMEIESILKLKK